MALGMALPDGTDLLHYFFEPTTAGGTTPTSKKVTTTPSTTAMMATYYEKLDPSEFCFPLGFDFKISGRTVQYFLVSALGGVYFSTEPIREPATSAPSGNFTGNCIHAKIYSSASTSAPSANRTGAQKKIAGKAPAYYLIEGETGNHVLTTQHNIAVNGDEWLFQCKFYEATGNFEFVVGDLPTAHISDAAGANAYYALDFGLFESAPTAGTQAYAVNDTINQSTFATRPWQLGITAIPSVGVLQHKVYIARNTTDETGWENPVPYGGGTANRALRIPKGQSPEPGRTIRFNYPECINPLPAFPESDYSVSKDNTDNSFTATVAYKMETYVNNGLYNIPDLGTIVAVSSASPEPDFTLENGTFYFKDHQFPESEGFIPTVLCNQMPGIGTSGNPPGSAYYINKITPISLTLTGLNKMDSRYIHIFRMSLACDGRPIYSPLCFTIAREPILDPPALLETVGLPTVNSVKLHVKPAEGASVMIVKSPTSINVSPKGQLKKGSKIGDAEVVDILNEEKTFDVPMKAGEGCYFLAITVNTSNPNKYAYSPANRLWVPARAAYNGLPGLLDMSKEICGIPNKENDGMKLTSLEFKNLETNIYRDLPLGWTRDLTLANGEKQVAFGLGHPGYANDVPIALCATAIYTKACKTDAITVPILADKNRILVTYEMQLWTADADGGVDKANAEDNDKFQLQYAIGNGTWQEMTSWTGKTLPAADDKGVYKLTYALVNDNLAGQYIRFRFVLNSVTRNNSTFVAIRAIEIKEDKVCKAPTDLTQTISQTTTTQFPVTWSDPKQTKATSYLV
ncbi:MAG: hypothetical protein K2G46_06775, partial [Bacteroidales bacterium]|nr:hypothetical protein [Bacteroidales bacterium]